MEEQEKGWIPQTIEEISDGISKMAPILQINWFGAILIIGLISTTAICTERLIVAWRSPQVNHLEK